MDFHGVVIVYGPEVCMDVEPTPPILMGAQKIVNCEDSPGVVASPFSLMRQICASNGQKTCISTYRCLH